MVKREYIQANKDWLEAKAKEEGVKALPKGIYYKVLREGRSSSARLLPEGRKNQESAKPTVRSIITAHYTGRTIDGKQFDSSRGGVPLACRLCDLIEGWIIAIQQMHISDNWELYIPAEMGYGKFSQPGIPGGSTLIFEIELKRRVSLQHPGLVGDAPLVEHRKLDRQRPLFWLCEASARR